VITIHYSAVKDRLEADTALLNKVFPSVRLDSTGDLIRESYLILYPTSPEELDDYRFTKEQDINSTATFIYDLKAVSSTAEGAGEVADHAITQLVGARLTVAGRKLDQIRMTGASRVEPDTSVKPPLFYCDLEFTLISRRP